MSYTKFARTLALIVPFCFGCAAQGEDPLGGDVGGSTASTGGTTASTGGTSNTGGTTSTGGVSATGGSATAGGSSTGGFGTGGTTTVNTDLPFTENWDDGDMAGWIASDPTLASNFSVVDSDMGKSLQFNSGNGECVLAGGNLAWTDVHLSLKFKIVSGNPTVVIAARLAGVKTYYYIELGNNHFKIRDRNNGASDVVPTDDPPLTTGQWYTIDFVVQGTTVTGSIDGTMIATGTMDSSPPLTSGGIGLGARSGSAGVVLFDDIHVTAP
jgi:hypothetical protein